MQSSDSGDSKEKLPGEGGRRWPEEGLNDENVERRNAEEIGDPDKEQRASAVHKRAQSSSSSSRLPAKRSGGFFWVAG